MSSATTLAPNPSVIDPYGGTDPFHGDHYAFHEAMSRGVWRHYSREDDSSSFTQLVSRRCITRSHPGTAEYAVTFIQYGGGSDALIVFDFAEPTSEFPEEHQEAVDFLRSHGRPILAGKLIAMLRNVEEDSDVPAINVVSLWDMARILAARRSFSDPIIGSDRHGIIHGQWQIIGNGVLVVSFLGRGEVLLIAQADESPDGDVLDISTRGPEQEILERFGHLVPSRN